MAASANPINPLTRRFASLIDRVASPLGFEDFLSLLDPTWSRRQTKARVKSIKSETPEVATITLVPGRTLDGSPWPGHLPGQHLIVGVDINGVRHKRAFSLSSPTSADGTVTITVSAASGGKVSQHIVKKIAVGAVVELSLPQGDSILPEDPTSLLFITAGSGITPVRAALLQLAANDAIGDVVLIHSSRTEVDAIFKDELRELAAAHQGLRFVERYTRQSDLQDRAIGTTDSTDASASSSGSAKGRLSASELDDFCPDWMNRRAFVCGPGQMVDHFVEYWEAAGIGDQIGFERFQLSPTSAKGVGGEVTFSSSGSKTLANGSTPILEVGEALGIQMPFGCRMGICHGCVVPLKSGCVRDLRNGKIHGEPGDMIQTCISAAAGDVEIDR